SAHFRYSSFDLEAPDTVLATGSQVFTDQVGSPSFLSFVYPWKSAAVSVYYQRTSDFHSHSFFEGTSLSTGSNFQRYDQVETKLGVAIFGAAAAFKLGSKVSVGGSAQASRVTLDSNLRFTFATIVGLTQAILAPDASDTTFTWNAGVLVTPVPKLSVG